jgi:two-component system sensor histidine kinase/response regulator
MLYLVNDILDFSQLEAKSLILNYEMTNIRNVIENCFSILSLKAESKGLNFSMSFDEKFPK